MDWLEDLDLTNEPPSEWSEYAVSLTPVDSHKQPVVLSIWANGLEEALNCGEILSAVYLG